MIQPLSNTSFNFNGLIKTLVSVFGVSARASEKSESNFITILKQFVDGKELHPIKALQDSEHLLPHLFYGFIIGCPQSDFNELRLVERLSITHVTTVKDQILFVASGSLHSWRDVIVNTKPNVTSTELLKYFDSRGLNQIFHKYKRTKVSDQILCLELK